MTGQQLECALSVSITSMRSNTIWLTIIIVTKWNLQCHQIACFLGCSSDQSLSHIEVVEATSLFRDGLAPG